MLESRNKPNPGKAIAEEIFQYLVWLTQKVEKFPRSHKFTLGDRLHLTSLSLLEQVVEATYTKDRGKLLRQAQLIVEQLRYLFRLCHETRLITPDAYEYAARSLDSVGRGIGGWKKAHDAASARQPVRSDRDVPSAASGGAAGDPR
jgi:hypothetical protein